MNVGGIVLCGGESRRMGTSKMWLSFGNECMLQRVVRILLRVVEPLVVVAGPDQDIPILPTIVEVARDSVSSKGPLQGLATGLAVIRDKVEAAYVSSCDVPLLQTAFVQYLISSLNGEKIVVPVENSFFHPLSAVYRTSVLPEINILLKKGQLRLTRLLEEGQVRAIPVEDLKGVDPDLQSLKNVNNKEDYQNALKYEGLV